MAKETPLQKLVRLCPDGVTGAAVKLSVSRQTIYNWLETGAPRRCELGIVHLVEQMERERAA